MRLINYHSILPVQHKMPICHLHLLWKSYWGSIKYKSVHNMESEEKKLSNAINENESWEVDTLFSSILMLNWNKPLFCQYLCQVFSKSTNVSMLTYSSYLQYPLLFSNYFPQFWPKLLGLAIPYVWESN